MHGETKRCVREHWGVGLVCVGVCGAGVGHRSWGREGDLTRQPQHDGGCTDLARTERANGERGTAML